MAAGERRPLSTAVTTAGAVHVRLAYRYLDSGDLDGLGSLLADGVRADRPGRPPVRGRDAVLGLLRDVCGGRHLLIDLAATDDEVAVAGVHTAPRGHAVGFSEFFGLSAEGLLVSMRRYHHSPRCRGDKARIGRGPRREAR